MTKTKESQKISEQQFSSKLLGRNTAPIYSPQAKKLIKDKVVLVTGAGGSIGSEIVRQLIVLKAKKIYCLDSDEYSLYKLQLELNGAALLTDDNIILADIKDKVSISRIFKKVTPEVVFHAAAHKHLPLLERSPSAAISTNVLGTENIAHACIENKVKHFVNISTDKAARPTSVLGMTKRLAELCTARYSGGKTKVASVRFGNVLGSRGSFLPTLMWQIDNKKPVMVTHPDISRFFMTIPEAAALVIEAASLSKGGETYVLDMGKSIKILDLINKYVKLTKNNNPKIIFTGLRPGEKMHEELFDPSEIHTLTKHSRISQVKVDEIGAINNAHIKQLKSMILTSNTPEDLKSNLKNMISEIENSPLIYEKTEKTFESFFSISKMINMTKEAIGYSNGSLLRGAIKP